MSTCFVFGISDSEITGGFFFTPTTPLGEIAISILLGQDEEEKYNMYHILLNIEDSMSKENVREINMYRKDLKHYFPEHFTKKIDFGKIDEWYPKVNTRAGIPVPVYLDM